MASSVGFYIMGSQAQVTVQAHPSDGAGPVLDAIAAEGVGGAPLQALMSRTGYDETYLSAVLGDLQACGLTSINQAQQYELTAFGSRARYLVPR